MASPSDSGTSIICEFFGGEAQKGVRDAIIAGFSGDNPALPLRQGIAATEALAQRANDPTEKKDLTRLADALDSAALSDGDIQAPYEAFFVKYATADRVAVTSG